MNSTRKTAVIVGVLFIIATVSTLMSSIFFGSIYDPNYLTAVSANENQVLIGVLLMITAIASIVSIPIMIYPILKKQSESLALGYVGARIFEGFFFLCCIYNRPAIYIVIKSRIYERNSSGCFLF